MHRKQKGFMIALCLCLLSLSGIFGMYRYRNSQNHLPETPVKGGGRRTGTDGRTGERGSKFQRNHCKGRNGRKRERRSQN